MPQLPLPRGWNQRVQSGARPLGWSRLSRSLHLYSADDLLYLATLALRALLSMPVVLLESLHHGEDLPTPRAPELVAGHDPPSSRRCCMIAQNTTILVDPQSVVDGFRSRYSQFEHSIERVDRQSAFCCLRVDVSTSKLARAVHLTIRRSSL